MSLKEKVINFAPNVIKERFPFNATSFKNFIELVEIKKAANVTTEYDIKGEILGSPSAGNDFGWLSFSTIYTAETPEKRKIKFTEVHPAGGFVTVSEHPTQDEIVQSFVTAESRVSTLKRIMPKEFKIKGPSAEMDEKTLKKMWSDTEKNHVKPFSKAKILFAKKQ